MTVRYIRGLTVAIGPLTESENADGVNSGGQAPFLEFTTTGKQNEFRVQFTIYKSSLGSPPNSSKILIYNLSKATVASISKRYTSCAMEMLYGNPEPGGEGILVSKSGVQTDLGLVSSGAVTNVYEYRQEGEIITQISTYDGINGTSLGIFTYNHQGTIQLNEVIKQAVATLPGVKTGTLNVSAQTGSKGITMAGRTTDILSRLASQYGFTWWINDGTFNAIDDGVTTSNIFSVSSNAGNLQNVSPILSDVVNIQIGVNVTMLLEPRLQPNDQLSIVSTVVPSLNGTYTVTNLTHNGDTHEGGNSWVTEVECLNTYLINSGGNL